MKIKNNAQRNSINVMYQRDIQYVWDAVRSFESFSWLLLIFSLRTMFHLDYIP